MKLKSAFTIIELLVVVIIIGILVTATAVGYNNYNNRIKTDHTRRLVEEIVQKMEVYKSSEAAYPNALGEAIDSHSLSYLLSHESRERATLGLSQTPSNSTPLAIQIQFCYRQNNNTDAVGAIINYWDFSKKQVASVSFGYAQTANVTCN